MAAIEEVLTDERDLHVRAHAPGVAHVDGGVRRHNRMWKPTDTTNHRVEIEERDLIESYKLGVNAYVQKPVDFEQFRSVVKEPGLFWLVINQAPPPEAFEAR